MIRKNKFDELEKKYAVLQKKISNYQMNEDLRDLDIKSNKKKLKEQKSCSENIEQELETYEKRNKELVNTIDEITKQINLMQSRSRPFERNSKGMKGRGSSENVLNYKK
jgi:chromosome segregation ATPase